MGSGNPKRNWWPWNKNPLPVNSDIAKLGMSLPGGSVVQHVTVGGRDEYSQPNETMMVFKGTNTT